MADSSVDLLSGSNDMLSETGGTPNSNTTASDTKIEADLVVVEEKLDLCGSLLNPGQGAARPSIHTDETVKAVIGFLEASAPRLVELISADPGLLGEAVLVHCFEVQERVTKMLEQVETLALTETTASTTAAAPAPATTSEPEFLLSLENNPGNVTSAPTGNAKTTGEEDPFGNVVSAPPASAAPPSSTAKADESSDFDDFFAGRQQQGS